MKNELRCPYCDFHFKVLAVNASEIPDLCPAICEECGGISLYCNGVFAKATEHEIAAIKQSPAWKSILGPVYDLIMAKKQEKS